MVVTYNSTVWTYSQIIILSYNRATGQSVGSRGGVVCANNASFSMEDSSLSFNHNSAALYAGVMYVEGSVIKVQRSLLVIQQRVMVGWCIPPSVPMPVQLITPYI